jgi:molybdopterin molybdotransferase
VRREVTPEELSQPLLPPPEAVARVLAALEPLAPRAMPLIECAGLVLAEDVVADRDVPSFANSAMDGYAVRAADVEGASAERPVVLAVTGEIPAGAAGETPVAPGTAARIMTGAPVPPGADAVVPWEDTDAGADGDSVAVRVPAPAGRHVRPAGEDLRSGTRVVVAGARLRPAHLAVLALLGRTEAVVVPRPRVAILSTGDELVPPGGDLGAGQVHDANGTLLTALCAQSGAEVIASDLVGDDPGKIEAWFAWNAERADLLVTSGGASVGEHDWVRDVLSRAGRVDLWKVAMRPGKPVLFGRVHGTPVLGLPGNPGSVLACTHVFVAPALRRLAGRTPAPRTVPGVLTAPVAGDPVRTFYCPVTLDGHEAAPVPSRSSQALSHAFEADGFAVIPPGGLPEGADVTVELFGD